MASKQECDLCYNKDCYCRDCRGVEGKEYCESNCGFTENSPMFYCISAIYHLDGKFMGDDNIGTKSTWGNQLTTA